MSQGGHSEPLLLFALSDQSTPSCLKVRGGGGGGVGGPCDYSVSPSPFSLDFGTSVSSFTIMREVNIFFGSENTILLELSLTVLDVDQSTKVG